jgi:hypothetical protein
VLRIRRSKQRVELSEGAQELKAKATAGQELTPEEYEEFRYELMPFEQQRKQPFLRERREVDFVLEKSLDEEPANRAATCVCSSSLHWHPFLGGTDGAKDRHDYDFGLVGH